MPFDLPSLDTLAQEFETQLILYDGTGTEAAQKTIQIPCGGSINWRYLETFDSDERRRAGARPYVIIRDFVARLFGYHGAQQNGSAVSARPCSVFKIFLLKDAAGMTAASPRRRPDNSRHFL